jgi:hypothetical protein
VIFIILGGIFVLTVSTIRWWKNEQERKHQVRGFEVKPIRGETPVLREKENDHG